MQLKVKKKKTKKVHIDDLHFDNKKWINTLELYKDETKIFNHRLEEVVKGNNKQKVMVQVEHFQNRFIRNNEVFDELLHEIRLDEQNLAKVAKENPVAIDHRLFDDHKELKEQMRIATDLFKADRKKFYRFVGEWL